MSVKLSNEFYYHHNNCSKIYFHNTIDDGHKQLSTPLELGKFTLFYYK